MDLCRQKTTMRPDFRYRKRRGANRLGPAGITFFWVENGTRFDLSWLFSPPSIRRRARSPSPTLAAMAGACSTKRPLTRLSFFARCSACLETFLLREESQVARQPLVSRARTYVLPFQIAFIEPPWSYNVGKSLHEKCPGMTKMAPGDVPGMQSGIYAVGYR